MWFNFRQRRESMRPKLDASNVVNFHRREGSAEMHSNLSTSLLTAR